MKYYIKIDGGFTGIPRILDGEIQLETDAAEALIAKLEEPVDPGVSDWPDALHYFIVLEDAGQKREAQYPEAYLPDLVRDFVDKVKLKRSGK